jgi:lipoate-protein ligase A
LIDRSLVSNLVEPYSNLAQEEALLERGPTEESVFLLYVNDPCIVVGRNQNPWAEAAPGASLPVLRRASGGGAVYHDPGNLNWAFIVPRREHDREAELALVLGALRAIGIELEAGPRGGLFVAGHGPYAGAKVSGTARRFAASRVLHHGTLLVEAELSRLGESLGGLELESTKALPSVPSRIANLCDLVPGLAMREAKAALSRGIAGMEPREARELVDASYAETVEKRLRSWDWTWGSTPAFSVALEWSGGRARLDVKGGRVEAASGPGAEALAPFLRRRFDYGLPSACVDAMEAAASPRIS